MVQGIPGQGDGAQRKCEAQSKREQPEGQSSVQDTTGQTKKTNHGALAQGKVGTTVSTDWEGKGAVKYGHVRRQRGEGQSKHSGKGPSG